MQQIAAIWIVPLAMILDAALGEPRWVWSRLPHPVVAIGALVGWLDRRLNHGSYRRLKGGAAVLGTLAPVGGLALLPGLLPYGWTVEVVAGAVLLAQRALSDHVGAVADGLARNLVEGRAAVRRIVGRDPEVLDEPGVARAAIESAAENFSDGVVAPLFWFAIAGLPGIAIYKAINTADSMIGHRTERHREFGWAAARLDDAVNLVPARISGLLLCIVGGGSISVMWRDAPRHRSPNAGWPEAAMASALGVALAGPRKYPGLAPVNDPFINAEGRSNAAPADVRNARHLLWQAWAVALAATVAAAMLISS